MWVGRCANSKETSCRSRYAPRRKSDLIGNLVAWLVGIAIQLQQVRLWSEWQYTAVLGISALVLGAAIQWRKGILPVLLSASSAGCLVGVSFAITGLHANYLDASVPKLTARHDVQIEGVIADWPRLGADVIGMTLAVKAWRELPQEGHAPTTWRDTGGRVKLSWYRADSGQKPKAGERWRFNARIKMPRGYANPGGWDSELRQWRDQVWGVGYVRAWQGEAATQIQQSPWHSWIGWRQAWRSALWRSAASESSKPWLSALWVGDQSALGVDDWHVLRVTGTAHLVSVSGLHLTVWASIASMLIGVLWRGVVFVRPRWGLRISSAGLIFIGTLILAGGYAALAGWEVPVQRAFCMLIAAMSLRLWAVDWPKSLVWLWVAVWVLTWDPWAALQAGFWLSFLAVGVLFILPQSNQERGLGIVWGTAKRQVQLSFALAPLSAWWFGQISWVGIAANAMVIPWVSWCVLPLTLAGALWAQFWVWAGDAIELLRLVLIWWAAVPGAMWMVTPVPAALCVLAFVGIGILLQHWPWRHKAVGLWMIVPSLLWRPDSPPKGHFELVALDVGQGTAVWVKTANHAILFDAGRRFRSGGDVGRIAIVPALRARGIRLDRLMLSHEDNDHIGGAASVLEAHPAAGVWASFDWTGSIAPAEAVRCAAGQSWVWDGVSLDVLHPPQALQYSQSRAGNDRSCVLRVSSESHSVLLTGDIGVKQEAEILKRYPDLQAHILVAAHHGSATSSGMQWMAHLKPKQAWVQAGYLNRYRHPAAKVTERWEALQQEWLSTASCGALSWRSDAPSRTGCWRLDHDHYWTRHVPR